MDEAQLRELIEQATVDCYDEDEAFWGFAATLEDELPFPFRATVLGDSVRVIGMSSRSDVRRGMLVDVEKNGHAAAFPLSELDVSQLEDDVAAWVAAWQLWSEY